MLKNTLIIFTAIFFGTMFLCIFALVFSLKAIEKLVSIPKPTVEPINSKTEIAHNQKEAA